MPLASTHAPADIQSAFRAVGREITTPRAQAVTAMIVKHGYEGAIRAASRLLGSDERQVGLDIREYSLAREEVYTPLAELIGHLAYEVALLRRPLPYGQADRDVRANAIDARIVRLASLVVGQERKAA